MITSSIEAILINKGTNQLKCFNNVFHVDITAHDVPGVISVSDNDIKGLGGDSEWVTQDKASDLMLLTGQIKKYQILSDQDINAEPSGYPCDICKEIISTSS